MILFLASTSLGTTRSIEDRIRQVAPHVKSKDAARYSKVIYKEAKRHGIDPRIVVAIIAQETMFRQVSTKRLDIDRLAGFVEVYYDIGIMQINLGTAMSYGLDVERLLVDDELQIKAGVKILADKVKLCEHLEAPWSCYHSKTEKHRTAYVEKVRRYLDE
jgi:soluble lytic murein transglycosylase-like protein